MTSRAAKWLRTCSTLPFLNLRILRAHAVGARVRVVFPKHRRAHAVVHEPVMNARRKLCLTVDIPTRILVRESNLQYGPRAHQFGDARARRAGSWLNTKGNA